MNELTTNTVSELDIQAQVNTIQRVMNKVMIKGTHYGTIPGAGDKNTLFKPGAEKIMMTFRLSGDPVVEDLSGDDVIRYRVKTVMRSPDGNIIGYGVGECSTDEMKYKWRGSVCDEEYNETAENRRRAKWNRGYNGKPAYQIKQVRTEPADIANTVLKMAKKRSLIDAVLTTTAASDCFTQDIEDLPAEYIAQNAAPVEIISPEQAVILQEWIDSVILSKDQLAKLLKWGKCESVSGLPASKFDQALVSIKGSAQ